eukprot:7384101-Prymnesium_polylepis.1
MAMRCELPLSPPSSPSSPPSPAPTGGSPEGEQHRAAAETDTWASSDRRDDVDDGDPVRASANGTAWQSQRDGARAFRLVDVGLLPRDVHTAPSTGRHTDDDDEPHDPVRGAYGRYAPTPFRSGGAASPGRGAASSERRGAVSDVSRARPYAGAARSSISGSEWAEGRTAARVLPAPPASVHYHRHYLEDRPRVTRRHSHHQDGDGSPPARAIPRSPRSPGGGSGSGLVAPLVYARIRPLASPDERGCGGGGGGGVRKRLASFGAASLTLEDSGVLTDYSFPTAVIAAPRDTQQHMYAVVGAPLVRQFIHGATDAMLAAYGPSNSGKTHTILGPRHAWATLHHVDWCAPGHGGA